MEYYRASVGSALEALSSSKQGLSSDAAEERQKRYGRNEIEIKGTPLWRKLVEPFMDVFTAVLAVAVIISIWHHDYVDAIIIAVIILASAIIYYVQSFSTERVLRALRASNQEFAEVLRDGTPVRLPQAELVPGDVIILAEGDRILADARLMQAESLRLDESQLTGESLPIDKNTSTIKNEKAIYERVNMVYQGSFVVSGTAHAIVTQTGNSTEFGKLAELSSESSGISPVQQKIDALVTKIIVIIITVSLISLFLSIQQGMDLYESVRFVIALAVSAVPEGLPIAISVVLVLGMRRMAAKQALARTMRSIETLGTVTTIATDKTGTLTENKLSVKDTWYLDSHPSDFLKSMKHSLNMASGKTHDPLDTAFVDYLQHEHSIDVTSNPLKSFPFNQSLAMSGSDYHEGSAYQLYIKGAPEPMIERADLTEAEREEAYQKLHEFTSNGYRVIALAHVAHDQPIQSLETLPAKARIHFAGLVAIADSLRPEAKAAIAQAVHAGVTVRMITGDHFETAYHIGKQLGLVTKRDQVYDCSHMSALSDDELEAVVTKTRVFSRVIPEDKHRLLTILKRNDITAMTGDGVNDVPALTNAHVGIAMGSGTSIAKDAGDIVLVDDNFKSIVDAIREGRIIFHNIKLMVAYLLATNAGEVLISLGALFLGAPVPLVPVQLLWVNLLTDTSMVIPLGLEPGDRTIMQRKPFPPKAPLLERYMITRIILIAITIGIIVLGLYLYFLQTHGVEYARTVAFISIIVTQWANALAMRSENESLIRVFKKPGRAFWIGLGISVALQCIALLSPLATYLYVVPVLPTDILVTVLISIIGPIAVIELHELWTNRRKITNEP